MQDLTKLEKTDFYLKDKITGNIIPVSGKNTAVQYQLWNKDLIKRKKGDKIKFEVLTYAEVFITMAKPIIKPIEEDEQEEIEAPVKKLDKRRKY